LSVVTKPVYRRIKSHTQSFVLQVLKNVQNFKVNTYKATELHEELNKAFESFFQEQPIGSSFPE